MYAFKLIWLKKVARGIKLSMNHAFEHQMTKLICTFLAYVKSRFSHDAAHFIAMYKMGLTAFGYILNNTRLKKVRNYLFSIIIQFCFIHTRFTIE